MRLSTSREQNTRTSTRIIQQNSVITILTPLSNAPSQTAQMITQMQTHHLQETRTALD